MFGERFSTADAVRDHHGRDESPYPPLPPDAVVFAQHAPTRSPDWSGSPPITASR